MAERKAQQKYYPPEWEPSMGMLNKFHGTHALRDRARKRDQGIMVIRYSSIEMPWNIWCNKCENVIIKGHRYNAEKKQAGNYFSTKIWDFKFRCQFCSNEIHMQTDPEHRDYKITEGGRRKVEGWTPELQLSEQIMDDDARVEMRADPFKKLEHLTKDKEVLFKKTDHFADLIDLQERNSRDDYVMNRLLRDKFREEKKVIKEVDDERKAKGFTIPLLAKSEEDEVAASKVQIATKTVDHQQYRKHQQALMASSSIFGNQYKSSPKEEAPKAAAMSDREKLIQKALKQGLSAKQLKPKAPISPTNPGFSRSMPPPASLKK